MKKFNSLLMVLVFVLSLFSFGMIAVDNSSITVSAWSPPEGTYVWNATEATTASNNSAWLPEGPIPEFSNLIFNDTSTVSCTFDLDTEFNSITLATGYTGTVTQGSNDINIGAGGFLREVGTFTPSSSYRTICAGDYVTGQSYAPNTMHLDMTGDNKILDVVITSSNYWPGLRIYGNITLQSSPHIVNIYVYGTLEIDTGQTLSNYRHTVGNIWYNEGEVTGNGTLRIYHRSGTHTLTPGDISCASIIVARDPFGGESHPIVNLQTDFNAVNLLIYSYHSTGTVTLGANGYNLSASDIETGTRGIIDFSTGTNHRFAGSFDGVATGSQVIPGTSTVYLEGTGKTVELQAVDSFYNLNVEGNYTFLTDVDILNSLNINGTIDNTDKIISASTVNINEPNTFDGEMKISNLLNINANTTFNKNVNVTSTILNSLEINADFNNIIYLNDTLTTNIQSIDSFTGYLYSESPFRIIHDNMSLRLTPNQEAGLTVNYWNRTTETNETVLEWSAINDHNSTYGITGLSKERYYTLYYDDIEIETFRGPSKIFASMGTGNYKIMVYDVYEVTGITYEFAFMMNLLFLFGAIAIAFIGYRWNIPLLGILATIVLVFAIVFIIETFKGFEYIPLLMLLVVIVITIKSVANNR
ncbi:MAG: hypothetical protein R6V50_02235 [Thermoplasmatota archaeon]